jgi:Domain of unknown function (DUF6457)
VADVDDWLSDVGLAHNVVRVAVPWTSYLIGVAVGRGASPTEAVRIVNELLPTGTTNE